MPDSSSQPSDLVSTIRNPNYSKLLIGQIVAAFGDRINQTALLSIVIYLLGNTAKYTADLIFWAAFSRPFLNLFAITIIDRLNRKHLMIFSDLGRAVLAALIPLVMAWVHHHYGIYVMVFLIGVFTSLFVPCRLAIMPNIMPSNLLMTANAISSQAGTVATLASMPIAGWIVENLGHEVSFLINAGTYVISAIFLFGIIPVSDGSESLRKEHHPVEDFKDGVRLIFKERLVFFYVILSGTICFLSGIFMICLFSYSVDVLGLKVGGTNNLFAIMGVGMVLGVVCLVKYTKRVERFEWPMLMLILCGAGMILMSFMHTPLKGGVCLGIVGFCAIMVQVPIDTFLQKNVGDDFRGRVFAAKGVLEGIAFLISLQFSKALIFQFGVLGVLKGMGFFAILLGGIAWYGGRSRLKA